MGVKDILATEGPRLALMAMASKSGGPQAMSAFMQGIQEREAMAAQQARQQQGDARAEEFHRAQMDNLTKDNERQQQAQEMEKLTRAIALIQEATRQQGETANDPIQAENAIMQQAQSAASLYGLPPDQLTGLVQNMGGRITGRKKKQAQEIYAQAEKTFGPEALANDAITLQTGDLFGDVKPSQLRALFSAPAVDASGAPVLPATGKRTPATPGSFEEFVDAPPERQAAITAARKQYMQADDKPVAAKGDALTPNATLDATLRLRDRFIKETQAAQAVNTQFRLMKSSLEAVKSGAEAPGSQGVLVTFQKILDPTSVVRESEYARSASGLSLLSRMQGTMDKIEKGGAGVPVQDLEQFVVLAEQFVRNQAQAAEATKKQIEGIAGDFGLKQEHITRDLGLPSAPAENPNQAIEDALRSQGITGRVIAVRPK